MPVFALALALAAADPSSAAWTTLPITIVFVDDVGEELLASAHTPVLDALTAGGLMFRQAWSYPNCSAARAALLTGRHATRTGVGSVLKWSAVDEPGLAYAETTFAELLPEPVHMFGKWHLSFRHTDPNAQGFDHYAGSLFNLSGPGVGYYDWLRTVNGVTSNETEYATKVTTDDALASTARVRLVAYHASHAPYENPPGGTATTDGRKVIEMIEYLDRDIGRLLKDYYGYVFWISDNGTPQTFGGEKGSLSEAGVNVRFVVHGPGIAPGTTNELVNVVDVFATLAEMRGVPSFAEDSVSFLPVMRGLRGRRTTNYVEKFKPNGDTTNREWAIRSRSHKLRFVPFPFPREDLYRMPGEVFVPPPYGPADQAAYDFLKSRLPF